MTTRDDILTALLAADPGAALKAHDQHELHARFARAQAKLHNIEKSSTVNAGQKRYNFAPLEDFLSMARAVLSAEGLSFHQPCFTSLEGQEAVITVQTVISFGVASIECSYSKTSPKSDIQGQGSMVTYMRRYTLQSMIGVCGGDEDDDAVITKTGPRVESEKPAERERAAEIRNAAKGKAAERRAEPQEPPAPWPFISYPDGMPEERAGIRHIGERVMRILGADFFGHPPPEALEGFADTVGRGMTEHLERKPSARADVEDFCSRVERAAKSDMGMSKLKDRVGAALDVPF